MGFWAPHVGPPRRSSSSGSTNPTTMRPSPLRWRHDCGLRSGPPCTGSGRAGARRCPPAAILALASFALVLADGRPRSLHWSGLFLARRSTHSSGSRDPMAVTRRWLFEAEFSGSKGGSVARARRRGAAPSRPRKQQVWRLWTTFACPASYWTLPKSGVASPSHVRGWGNRAAAARSVLGAAQPQHSVRAHGCVLSSGALFWLMFTPESGPNRTLVRERGARKKRVVMACQNSMRIHGSYRACRARCDMKDVGRHDVSRLQSCSSRRRCLIDRAGTRPSCKVLCPLPTG